MDLSPFLSFMDLRLKLSLIQPLDNANKLNSLNMYLSPSLSVIVHGTVCLTFKRLPDSV